jgi:predicted nucleic acid-binding protein
VIVALWDADLHLSALAEAALEDAFRRGRLIVAAPVYAELLAAPGRSEALVNSFLEENGISIDWDLNEAIWRSTARAFQAYAERRRKQRDMGPRRLLVDFLVGAHSLVRGYRLLTLDERHYRAAFPALKLEAI